MSGHRPLPPRPSLESERKHAKKLLRELRAGAPEAASRATLLPGGARDPATLQLSDAQLIVAREYGFASWPKLVGYYTTWRRHELVGPRWESYDLAWYETQAGQWLIKHQRRLPGAAHMLASLVPRFYGMTDDQIHAAEVTLDDARLIVARMLRLPNWEALVEWVATERAPSREKVQASPYGQAVATIQDGDIDALERLATAHPEVFEPEYRGGPMGARLISSAWHAERKNPGERATAVTGWLVARGVDEAAVATELLHRRMFPRPALGDVTFFLSRGADPAWIPPDGIGLLERMLLSSWDPAPVDFVATLVPAPRTLWAAAGLNDVEGMRPFLGAHGQVTDAAREHRPDLLAVGLQLPPRPGASDLEILCEAFYFAGVLQRAGVMDLLLAHGLPIDHAPWGTPLLNFAVGNRMIRLVELLVERGADCDKQGFMPSMTARDLAAERLKDHPDDERVQRIAEVVG